MPSELPGFDSKVAEHRTPGTTRHECSAERFLTPFPQPGGWTGGGTGGVIMRNMRYYLEDKPHYLDDPDGEYWFDKKGEGGRLYLRPRMTSTRTSPASKPGSGRTS